MESLFNISFWVKERAIDWSWLGLDTPGKEREADSLAVAIEWQCFKISERALIDFFMDVPWSASMAVLRVLQMCEEDDLNILQMPKTCPWCNHTLKLEGMSLYMQIYTYLGTRQDWQRMHQHLYWYPGRVRGQETGIPKCEGTSLSEGQEGDQGL